MKIFILLLDLGYYPEEHYIKAISAYDLDEAKNILLEQEFADNPEITIQDINESLSEWIEVPVSLSKKGTYFPGEVTHILTGGEHSTTRAIEIFKRR